MFEQAEKIWFTGQFALVLLKCIRAHDALQEGHGAMDKAFEKGRIDFIPFIPRSIWEYQQQLRVRTLRDKVRALIAARKSVDSANGHASGIVEIIFGDRPTFRRFPSREKREVCTARSELKDQE